MALTRSQLMVLFLMGVVSLSLSHRISRRIPLWETSDELVDWAPRSSREAETDETDRDHPVDKLIVAAAEVVPAGLRNSGRNANVTPSTDSDCAGFDDNFRCIGSITTNFHKFRNKLKDVAATSSSFEKIDEVFSSLKKMKRAESSGQPEEKAAAASNLANTPEVASSELVEGMEEPSQNVEMEASEPYELKEEMEEGTESDSIKEEKMSPRRVVEDEVDPSLLSEMEVPKSSHREQESARLSVPLGADNEEMEAASVGVVMPEQAASRRTRLMDLAAMGAMAAGPVPRRSAEQDADSSRLCARHMGGCVHVGDKRQTVQGKLSRQMRRILQPSQWR